MHKKLFIPGPIEVREEILKEMGRPMIGHRTKDFEALFLNIKPKLQNLLYTKNDVLISTSSGSGFMEAAVRNCVSKKVLSCVCGAFSDKWKEIAIACGKEADVVSVEWGKAIKPEMVEEKLSSGNYEAVHVTHCETTTGVLNPIEEISEIMKTYPDVLFFVDAVSSMGGIKIDVDKLGIDICLSSSQKAIGLPPGIAVASVSPKAYEKAKTVLGRGYYFDLIELKKSYEKNQTSYTPSVSHLYALDKQLDYMLKEGIENRFERHRQMGEMTRKWAVESGFEIFAEEGYESDTVSCMTNSKKVDLKKLKEELGKKGYLFDSGYRKLNEKLEAKGKMLTFRIAHMGDMTEQDIKELLEDIDEIIS